MAEALLSLARVRRMRFESTKSDGELARITFDEFGHPIPLAGSGQEALLPEFDPETTPLRERMGEELANFLIREQPEMARRLGLFPPLALIEENHGDEESNDNNEEGKS